MENKYVKTSSSNSIEELKDKIIDKNTALFLCFFGSDCDSNDIYETLKNTNTKFLGCMDSGRLIDNKYLLDTKTIVGISISKDVIKSVEIGCVDMGEGQSKEIIDKKSREELKKLAESIDVNLDNPDMERDLIINLVYGLNSATPYLDGQTAISWSLQSVGGSSGGKTDFVKTDVLYNDGVGKYGVFALLKLNDKFAYTLGRVSSFDEVPTEELKVTKLANPRHILELNNKPATEEYKRNIGHKGNLTPEIFANYTLGLEPGDGEKLITSIMKDDGKTGLLTYNDVVEGTQFKLFKAKSQKSEREKMLSELKQKELIGYISFDCILCYLARNSLNEVEPIANVYNSNLKNLPRVGFGTFSENIGGANINQTETYLAFYKK